MTRWLFIKYKKVVITVRVVRGHIELMNRKIVCGAHLNVRGVLT